MQNAPAKPKRDRRFERSQQNYDITLQFSERYSTIVMHCGQRLACGAGFLQRQNTANLRDQCSPIE
jgi:hypothetical protein